MSSRFRDGQVRMFTPASIVRTLGFRNRGRHVRFVKLSQKQRDSITSRIRRVLGIQKKKVAMNGGLSIQAINNVLRSMDPLDLDTDETIAVEMAFSLLASGTYVAPKQSYGSLPWEILACVLFDGGTGAFNLAEWAFEVVRQAAKDSRRPSGGCADTHSTWMPSGSACKLFN